MIRLLVAVALLAGCSRGGGTDEVETKRYPDKPPGETVIPKNVQIAVSIDGTAGPAITTAILESTKPDFADDHYRAWRIPTLVAAAKDAKVVEAVEPDGSAVRYPMPTPEGLEPVLYLSRRGELNIGVLDPKKPFPAYHGQGGRLHRAGDSNPRASPVARLEIKHTTP